VNQLQPLRKEAAVASSGVIVLTAPQPCGGTSLLFWSEGIPATQLLKLVVREEGRVQNIEGGWAPSKYLDLPISSWTISHDL
jgi:hypothetical protein